ncbi:MAG: SIMPL domain-containing protein [Rectinemataceae bacterium]
MISLKSSVRKPVRVNSPVSAFVFAAFVALASFAAVFPAAAAPGTISVSGEGSADFVPEFVDMSFSVSASAPGYREAQKKLMDSAAQVIETVSSLPWIDARDLATQSFSLSEIWNYEDGGRKSGGYIGTTGLTLRVRNLDRYQDTILALLDAGVNGIEQATFGLSDEAALGVKALEAAFADARRKAEALAKAAGRSLGQAVVVREEGAPAPEMLRVATMKAFADGAGGSADIIAEGTRKITARIFVEFVLE